MNSNTPPINTPLQRGESDPRPCSNGFNRLADPPVNWPQRQQQHREDELQMSRELFQFAREQIARARARPFDKAPHKDLVKILELASKLGRQATGLGDTAPVDMRAADEQFFADIERVYGRSSEGRDGAPPPSANTAKSETPPPNSHDSQTPNPEAPQPP